MQVAQTDNQAVLRGTVLSDPVFSHTVRGIAFFTVSLSVPRLSGRADIINLLLSAPLLETFPLSTHQSIEVKGEVRSYNNRSGIGHRLIISLYAQEILPCTEEPCNSVHLQGVLCKPPILRRTPLGRDICDFLLAVNRRYHRADYLPCISWGSLATFAAQLEVGDVIALEGRLQSRVYLKGSEGEEHTAFELSVMSMGLLE